jgi:ElaB/YqjD/DUF883 family membrane-anchored ribosome-binding protein
MSNVANPSQANEENTKKGQSGSMSDKVSDVANQAGSFIADKASEAGKYVSDSAKSMASSAMHSAQDAASYMGKRTDDARSSVGGSFKSMADGVRSVGGEEGMMHDAAGSFAAGLETAGKYLEEQDFSHMAEDMTNVIRRNPIPAVCIAAGIGFLLARAVTSSRS